MTKISKLMATAAAATLVFAPVATQAAPARASAAAQDASKMDGDGNYLLYILAAIAAVVAIVLITDGKNNPVSP